MSQGIYTGAGDSDSGAQENPLAVWLRNVPTWLDQVCWPSFIFYKQRVTQRKCIILYNCLITKNKTRSYCGSCIKSIIFFLIYPL